MISDKELQKKVTILSNKLKAGHFNEVINDAKKYKRNLKENASEFGNGDSDKIFLKLLDEIKIWNLNCQKQFQDLKYE